MIEFKIYKKPSSNNDFEDNKSHYYKMNELKPPRRQSDEYQENIFSILLKPDDEKPTRRPTPFPPPLPIRPVLTLRPNNNNNNSSRPSKPNTNMRDLENEDNSTLSLNNSSTNAPPPRPIRPERPDPNGNADSLRPIKPDFDNQQKTTKKPIIMDLELNSEFLFDDPFTRSSNSNSASSPKLKFETFYLFIIMIIKLLNFLSIQNGLMSITKYL